jgi:hypothetical protein
VKLAIWGFYAKKQGLGSTFVVSFGEHGRIDDVFHHGIHDSELTCIARRAGSAYRLARHGDRDVNDLAEVLEEETFPFDIGLLHAYFFLLASSQ